MNTFTQANEPLISICIPTYNCAQFLPAAIESVVRQQLSNVEIVVVDNASEDDTEAVIKALNNPSIRYFRNASNVGSRKNNNLCLSYARGEYIRFLCADDVLIDGIVRKQLDVLQGNPEVSLVTCNMTVTDSDLNPQYTYRFYPGNDGGTRLKRACLSGFGNYIGGITNFMFRRADASGLAFDHTYKWVSDLKFALQLLERGAYRNIDEVGYLYRRHANTDTAVNCPTEIRAKEYVRLIEEFRGWTLVGGLHGIRNVKVIRWPGALRMIRKSLTVPRTLQVPVALRDVLRMRRIARGQTVSAA